MTATVSMERRILDDLRAHPCSTWLDVETRLGITANLAALVDAMDSRSRLVRDHRVVAVHPPGLRSVYRLPTPAEVEARMRVTRSGELPDVEPLEREAA